MNNTKLKDVTIAIPCYNEEKHIEKVIRGFIENKYDFIKSILVVDGGSSDNTCAIVNKIANEDKRICLLHNPFRLQSHALNLAISQCDTEIFLRADAHCEYDEYYVKYCVEALNTTGALNVGGAQRFVAQTLFQAAIAIAVRSVLGSGGAAYRDPSFNGFADTVFLGCFITSILKKIGGYDLSAITNEDYGLNIRLRIFSESNVTNQDAELNTRLKGVRNDAIYVSSKIKVWYFPRNSTIALFKQYYKYGRGRALTSALHRKISFRGLVPALGVTFAIAYIILYLTTYNSESNNAMEIIAFVIILAILTESCRVCFKVRNYLNREIWRGNNFLQNSLLLSPLVAFVIIVMASSHGIGFINQTFKMLITQKRTW